MKSQSILIGWRRLAPLFVVLSAFAPAWAMAGEPLPDFNIQFIERNVIVPETAPAAVYLDVAVNGDFAFVLKRLYIASPAIGQIEVFDVKERFKPRSVATLEIPGDPLEIAVKDRFAYVSSWSDARGMLMSIIDISVPSAPLKRSDISIEYPGGFFVWAIKGNYVYFISGEDGLSVIDASDPASPRIAGRSEIHGNKVISGAGSYLYVCSVTEGLQIVDVSDPVNPRVAAVYKGRYERLVAASVGDYIWLNGNFADTSRVPVDEILEMSNPLAPQVVGEDNRYHSALFGEYIGISRGQVVGGMAFVGEWWSRGQDDGYVTTLTALDVRNLGHVQRIGVYSRDRMGMYPSSDRFVALEDGTIYMPDWFTFKTLEAIRQPRLEVRQIGDEIELSWSPDAGQFMPQQCLQIGSDNSWVDIPTPPSLSENRYSSRLKKTPNSVFFRLARL